MNLVFHKIKELCSWLQTSTSVLQSAEQREAGVWASQWCSRENDAIPSALHSNRSNTCDWAAHAKQDWGRQRKMYSDAQQRFQN